MVMMMIIITITIITDDGDDHSATVSELWAWSSRNVAFVYFFYII